mmetsp:Transcript_2207/g.5615  ORF Transcript_2207/g.5615 Transcript_2207/m.5615 type:complete len:301 (+) Transcript_2207:345-1247(+)
MPATCGCSRSLIRAHVLLAGGHVLLVHLLPHLAHTVLGQVDPLHASQVSAHVLPVELLALHVGGDERGQRAHDALLAVADDGDVREGLVAVLDRHLGDDHGELRVELGKLLAHRQQELVQVGAVLERAPEPDDDGRVRLALDPQHAAQARVGARLLHRVAHRADHVEPLRARTGVTGLPWLPIDDEAGTTDCGGHQAHAVRQLVLKQATRKLHLGAQLIQALKAAVGLVRRRGACVRPLAVGLAEHEHLAGHGVATWGGHGLPVVGVLPCHVALASQNPHVQHIGVGGQCNLGAGGLRRW